MKSPKYKNTTAVNINRPCLRGTPTAVDLPKSFKRSVRQVNGIETERRTCATIAVRIHMSNICLKYPGQIQKSGLLFRH